MRDLTLSGMRDLTQSEWDRMTTAKRANRQIDRYPKMLPETKKMLEEFYEPYNKRLAALLGDDRCGDRHGKSH
jgi:N-acetylgalactosamine 4-sulfate 6-O-sulfotransferase